jgi:electron transfer flavoprotein alpha subunit
MANVLAVTEQRDGALRKTSREVVWAARQLADAMGGGTVDALVLGAAGVDAAGGRLGEVGADRVLVAEHETFAKYAPDGYAATAAAAAKGGTYGAVLVAATATGKDLAPRLAALLDAPLATDVTAVGFADGKVTATRPVYAGKAMQQVAFDAPLAVASLRPNTFTPGSAAKAGAIGKVAAVAAPARVVVREVKAAGPGKLDVAEAPVVVSGGRGLKGPEQFALLEGLAKAFGNAAVGASRAVVDAGWRPHAEQVGQTGKTVSPQLYVAVGISGAIQHLAGMKTAKVIVAINKDKDAPIFQVADYGIVGDLFEIVPRLTEEIVKAKAG